MHRYRKSNERDLEIMLLVIVSPAGGRKSLGVDHKLPSVKIDEKGAKLVILNARHSSQKDVIVSKSKAEVKRVLPTV